MSDNEIDDLFDEGGDDDNQQQQQEQQQEQLEQQQQQQDEGMEDLEDDMDDEQPQQQPPAAAAGADGRDIEADLFGSDEDDELGGGGAAAAADEATGAPINVSAPLLQRPPAGKLLLLKVPNLIKFDPAPYDPDTTDLEPEEVAEKGNKRRFRPNDINVVRWRFRQNPDGSLSRESNARYVQWSDGTESIMLGDEVLAMDRQQQPKANTYVHVVRYDAIQGLAHIKQTVHLKPVSLDSKLHQRLKMTVQKAVRKDDKVRVHLAARNPELEKAEAEKRAEEMAKLRRSQARVGERARVPKQRPQTFTAAYIEDDEDEGDLYYNGPGGGRGGGDDADDYYRRPRDDEEAAARLQSAKRSTPPPASIRSSKQPRVEQQPAEEEEAEEMQEAAAKSAPGLKVRRGAILDDEDDD